MKGHYTLTMCGGPDDGATMVVDSPGVLIRATCVDGTSFWVPIHDVGGHELIAVWPAGVTWEGDDR